jgi:ribosome-associated toxin RatA of RatAB toxin-antitoxin module
MLDSTYLVVKIEKAPSRNHSTLFAFECDESNLDQKASKVNFHVHYHFREFLLIALIHEVQSVLMLNMPSLGSEG